MAWVEEGLPRVADGRAPIIGARLWPGRWAKLAVGPAGKESAQHMFFFLFFFFFSVFFSFYF
jgi:hypothetical protein